MSPALQECAESATETAANVGEEVAGLCWFLVEVTKPIWGAVLATAVTGAILFGAGAVAALAGIDPRVVVIGLPCLGGAGLLLGLVAENDRDLYD